MSVQENMEGIVQEEWQCGICDEENIVNLDTTKSALFLDTEDEFWVKCKQCGITFHSNCVLHVCKLTIDDIKKMGFFNCCVEPQLEESHGL